MVFPKHRDTVPQTTITSNPAVMGGAPCVSGTRIPASIIIVQLEAGLTAEEIFRHYPGLPVDGIAVVREWAAAQGRQVPLPRLPSE